MDKNFVLTRFGHSIPCPGMSKRGFSHFLVGFTREGEDASLRRTMNSERPGLRTDFDREFTVARLTLLLGALMFVYCPEIILGTHALFYRDAGQFGYPVGIYLRNSLLHGEVPLWNPYSDCGTPFLAAMAHAGALSAVSHLRVAAGAVVDEFVHPGACFLAGTGMYFLAWHWFGNRFAASAAGLAFAWNGLMLHCWMWPSLIATLAWMPWVLWLCERVRTEGRRTLILAALAGGMQMLTGSPEEIIYTWLIVLGSFLVGIWPQKRMFWSGLGRLTCVVALVAGLAAAQTFSHGWTCFGTGTARPQPGEMIGRCLFGARLIFWCRFSARCNPSPGCACSPGSGVGFPLYYMGMRDAAAGICWA